MAGPKPRFILRVYKSDKMGVYKAGKDYIVYKTGEKAGMSAADLNSKKKLAKLVADCPSVSQKMLDEQYKGWEQIVQFAKDYTDCNE